MRKGQTNRHHDQGVMQHYILTTACKLNETSASFVSGGIFQIAILIRPWESEPGIKSGREMSECVLLRWLFLWPSVPAIRHRGGTEAANWVSVSLSLFLSFHCLLAHSDHKLSVSHTTFNQQDKLFLREREREEGSNKTTNKKNREQTGNRCWCGREQKRRQKYRGIQNKMLVYRQNKLTFCSFSVKLWINVTPSPSHWHN